MAGQQRQRAPQTSPRPQARPAGRGPQPQGQRQQLPTGANAPIPQRRPQPRPDDLRGPPQTPGMYDGLGITDETATYGRLGRTQRRGDPSEVILHQTGSNDADSARRAYSQRIREGSSIGAHYLIDQEGGTSLTVPTDRVVSHAVGHNSSSVGIENAGAPTAVNPRGDLHAQIEALDLTPQLKARLLAMSPAELRQTMSDNGNNIYGDITGEQKRANWLLLQRLAEDHDLDLGSDVHAHEDVQAKTIGEGENIEEFIDTMVAWPGRVEELATRIEGLRASGESEERLAELEAYLRAEQARRHAVEVDGTPQERNALEGEALIGQTDGPAHLREDMREDFYGDFWGHMGRLDEALS